MRTTLGWAALLATAAGPAGAGSWQPILNTETGRGAVVCSEDFTHCFGLRCVAERGTEFFLMLADTAEPEGEITFRIDGVAVRAKPYLRVGEFGDLVTPYDGVRDEGLIRALRSGGALRVDLESHALEFPLDGSGRAIDGALEVCR